LLFIARDCDCNAGEVNRIILSIRSDGDVAIASALFELYQSVGAKIWMQKVKNICSKVKIVLEIILKIDNIM
jgi:hypothetical protein